jgi:hypothetical protein
VSYFSGGFDGGRGGGRAFDGGGFGGGGGRYGGFGGGGRYGGFGGGGRYGGGRYHEEQQQQQQQQGGQPSYVRPVGAPLPLVSGGVHSAVQREIEVLLAGGCALVNAHSCRRLALGVWFMHVHPSWCEASCCRRSVVGCRRRTLSPHARATTLPPHVAHTTPRTGQSYGQLMAMERDITAKLSAGEGDPEYWEVRVCRRRPGRGASTRRRRPPRSCVACMHP